jgi:hypothetical protein
MRALEALVWDVVVFDEAHGLTGRSDRSAAARLLAARGRRVILLTATPHSGDDAAFGTLCAMGAIEGDAQPLALFRRSRRVRASGCRRRSRLLAVAPTAAERAMFDVLQGYARGVRREAPREHAAGARLAMGILARRACSSAESLARSVERRLVLLGADAAPAAAQLQLPLADTDLDGEPGMELAVRGLPDEAEERAALVRILGLARAAAGRESKIAVLGRLLRRCRQPAIVFTEYRDTLERLADSLGLVNFAMLHGGLGAAERRRQLQRFTHGSAGVLLATDAASEGLNLHRRCRIAINLEMPWTPTRFEQRAGRVDRLGQARPPHVVTIAARGTFEDGVIARFLRRQASVQAAAPFDADSKQPQAAGVIALDLRSEADAEAHRVGQVVSAVAARRRGRPTAQTAEGPRPSAGILRRRMCSALYWGLALRFLDHRGALVWQAVVGCRAHAQLPCGASRGDARDALNAVTNAAAPELLQAAVLAHAKHLEQLTVEIRNATSMLGAREIAIEAALRRYQARLALRLLQPGLFDRRPAGDAEGEPLADALAAVGEHRAALDRLRHPVEGERELLFLVAAGA